MISQMNKNLATNPNSNKTQALKKQVWQLDYVQLYFEWHNWDIQLHNWFGVFFFKNKTIMLPYHITLSKKDHNLFLILDLLSTTCFKQNM